MKPSARKARAKIGARAKATNHWRQRARELKTDLRDAVKESAAWRRSSTAWRRRAATWKRRAIEAEIDLLRTKHAAGALLKRAHRVLH